MMNAYTKQIKEALALTLEPQAVKFIAPGEPLPANVVPALEKYGHLALCQALALAKRQGKTVYTCKKAEWCWAPLVALGYVPCTPDCEAFGEICRHLGMADLEKAKTFFAGFPMLPYGKYEGVLIGPAASAEFAADVVLINCEDNFQLRTLLGAIKNMTGKLLNVSLDMIDSCVHTLVKSMLTGDYTLAIPDPGDQERALTDKHEIILGVPAARLGELAQGLQALSQRKMGYRDMQMQMPFDFERPAFYNTLYALWGLDQGKVWDR